MPDSELELIQLESLYLNICHEAGVKSNRTLASGTTK